MNETRISFSYRDFQELQLRLGRIRNCLTRIESPLPSVDKAAAMLSGLFANENCAKDIADSLIYALRTFDRISNRNERMLCG